MFKRISVLLLNIIICKYLYAKPVEASIFYPIITDLANIHEITRIYESIGCSSLPLSTKKFDFKWTNHTIQENINALSTAVYSVKKYRNPTQTDAQPGQSQSIDLLMSSDIKDFNRLNPTGKSLVCRIIKKKELSMTAKKNFETSHIPHELQELIRAYYPIPSDYESGFIKTTSQTGDEVSVTTPFIDNFLDSVSGKVVYDIGSGFGINTKHALERGAKQVVAIDFSIEQLQAVIGRTPPDKIKNLSILIGKVPKILNEIPENSVDIVLLSHVLHYLNPEEADATLKGIHKILNNGGIAYLQALTYSAAPYSENYDKNHVPFLWGLYGKQNEYDTAVANGKEHSHWPTYLGPLEKLPMIHPQYLPALIEACKRNGFKILQTGTYSLRSGQLSESGGDALGIIAIKETLNHFLDHK